MRVNAFTRRASAGQKFLPTQGYRISLQYILLGGKTFKQFSVTPHFNMFRVSHTGTAEFKDNAKFNNFSKNNYSTVMQRGTNNLLLNFRIYIVVNGILNTFFENRTEEVKPNSLNAFSWLVCLT